MIDREALERDVERVANLMREQASIGDDIKEICKAADDAGTCTRRELRRLARESLMDHDVLTAQLDRMETLRYALGQLEDTPLGDAAVKSVGKRKPQTDLEDVIGPVPGTRRHDDIAEESGESYSGPDDSWRLREPPEAV
jgi:uncharacterized protein (UPF0335 family)